MKLSTVVKAAPRLFVLAGLCACHQLAGKPGESILFTTGGGLLTEIGGDILVQLFNRFTNPDLDSLAKVIGRALEQVCREHAPGVKDVSAKWNRLPASEHARLRQLSRQEIDSLLKWTNANEEMRRLANYLAQRDGVFSSMRRDLTPGEQAELARALVQHLPDAILRVLSEDKSQQTWREMVLRTLQEHNIKLDKLIDLSTHIKEGVNELLRDNAEPRRRVALALPLNLVGAAPMPIDDYEESDNLLHRLHTGFQDSDPQRWRQVLTGGRALGKTRAATQYCHRYQDDYKHILWVDAADPASLDARLMDAARGLGLLPVGEAPTGAHLRGLSDWLATRDDYLLVLDGVEDFEHVKAAFPMPTRGRVLATTHLEDPMPWTHLHPVEMPVLSTEEGLKLLVRRVQREPRDEAEREEARRLVVALEANPLLLELAAGYLWWPNRTFTQLRLDFEQRRLETFATADDAKLADLLTIFNRLADRLENGSALLQRVVFLSPEAITLNILKSLYRTTPGALGAAVDDLVRYSLLHPSGNGGGWSMHRLVQEVVKHRMSPGSRNAYALQTIDALEKLLPPPTEEDWTQIEPLLAHTLVVADSVRRYGLKSANAGALLHRACLYLVRKERYPAAARLLTEMNARELALQINPDSLKELLNQALSVETEEMAGVLSEIGVHFLTEGRYQEALPLIERALAIFEKVRGPEHTDTATSLNYLGVTYNYLGEHDKALPLIERALAIREKVLGPEHSDTATSLSYLGATYNYLGEHDKALPLMERALAIREKVPGPEHPDTATSLSDLVATYNHLGEHEGTSSDGAGSRDP